MERFIPECRMERFIPEWKHYRAIHSMYPPKNLFDEDAGVNDILAELEGMTNDRLHRWKEFVDPADVRTGNGWGAVMASFCYVSPGRFNSKDFGAYYCGDSPRTAIKEWAHHQAKTWREFNYTEEASAVARCYFGTFKHELFDIREDQKAHNPDSYHYSQAIANLRRVDGEWGLIYRSVRNPGGLCAALFRPPATSQVKQAGHYVVIWNGNDFNEFARVGEYEKL